ncbi:hypothetical protein [Shewanella sp.]|uniref:restriction endonuclease n=1 Tax=Shewanella sp. TaxID=50422 RepID=UPI00257E9DF0|nr:hypothetical protein [Shewanella sp.]
MRTIQLLCASPTFEKIDNLNDLRTLDIPKITDGEKFEFLIRDIYRNNPIFDFVELNGRRGQRQKGVDVFARNEKSNEWIGIQCKCRAKGKPLSESDVNTEIDKAKDFNPKISTFYIYTTCERDVETQELEREINVKQIEANDFKVKIRFWPDIEELLKEENNFNVYYKYYNKFFADNLTLGHSVSKLFNLDLHFDGKPDTHYELMVGKIPDYKDSGHRNASYYRGTYFIANLLQNSNETFTMPCYDSDITQAIPNNIDRHRICKWLNSLSSIEEFISSDEETFNFSLSHKERLEFMKEDDV